VPYSQIVRTLDKMQMSK